MVHVKAQYSGMIRRFSIESEHPKLSQVQSALTERFPSVKFPAAAAWVFFVDQDGDKCEMSTREDLDEALLLTPGHLNVFIAAEGGEARAALETVTNGGTKAGGVRLLTCIEKLIVGTNDSNLKDALVRAREGPLGVNEGVEEKKVIRAVEGALRLFVERVADDAGGNAGKAGDFLVRCMTRVAKILTEAGVSSERTGKVMHCIEQVVANPRVKVALLSGEAKTIFPKPKTPVGTADESAGKDVTMEEGTDVAAMEMDATMAAPGSKPGQDSEAPKKSAPAAGPLFAIIHGSTTPAAKVAVKTARKTIVANGEGPALLPCKPAIRKQTMQFVGKHFGNGHDPVAPAAIEEYVGAIQGILDGAGVSEAGQTVFIAAVRALVDDAGARVAAVAARLQLKAVPKKPRSENAATVE